MRKLFRLRWIADKHERSLGVLFRILGIDCTVLLVGYLTDMRVIDLRIPAPNGVYLQVFCLIVAVSRIQDDSIYEG